MTNQSAQPITEKSFARKLSEAFDGRDWKPVVDIIKEVTGHEFAPGSKPLLTEPGSVIIATEVRGETGKWRMIRDGIGDWYSPVKVNGRHWHRPEYIAAWTEARVVPAAAPVTLTEDQVGEMWDQDYGEGSPSLDWATFNDRWQHHIAGTVNAILAQYAAPAEGEPIASAAKPIDPHDVRVGDRVRLVLDNGDEATLTARAAADNYICSMKNAYDVSAIRSVRLLHREEA